MHGGQSFVRWPALRRCVKIHHVTDHADSECVLLVQIPGPKKVQLLGPSTATVCAISFSVHCCYTCRRGAPEVPRGAPCRGAVTCTSRSKVQTPHILIEFLASTCSKSLYQPGNSCLPSAFDSRCQDLVLLENRCQMFFDHYFEFCPRQP